MKDTEFREATERILEEEKLNVLVSERMEEAGVVNQKEDWEI